MSHSSSDIPFHPIPPSNSTCTVHLLQAGGLILPASLVFRPDPSIPHPKDFYVPDYVFLIHHPPTSTTYLFDLGIRKDLHNLPPYIVKYVLPSFTCTPKSPADILRKHGNPDQQPDKIKAVVFSHQHFDHVGDGTRTGGFRDDLELWVGPTCCEYARPGYPIDENAPTLSETLPVDGSRRVIELFISDAELARTGDKREGVVEKARQEGKYEAVDLSVPGEGGWRRMGAFERACDVFGDGAAWFVDAPGHSGGHLMMLVRVDEGWVLLGGDCYHHPALLKNPDLTARPPYSKGGMHADPEVAIDTMERTKIMSEQDDIMVFGAHDFSIGEAIAPGVREIEGLVCINDWKAKDWKKDSSIKGAAFL